MIEINCDPKDWNASKKHVKKEANVVGLPITVRCIDGAKLKSFTAYPTMAAIKKVEKIIGRKIAPAPKIPAALKRILTK